MDGREIRYGIITGTPYQPLIKNAIASWNVGNCIDILPDSAATIEDLRYGAGDFGATGWDGLWTPQTGADSVRLNLYYVDRDNYSNNKIQGVWAHETGHGLGIGDHAASYGAILMSGSTPTRGSTYTPKSHDIVDYESAWGNCW